MQKRIELDGATCRIARNGNLSFVPASRYSIYLLMTSVGLLAARPWVEALGFNIVALLLVCAGVGLILWANQAKVRILAGSDTIEWRRWFRSRRCSFAEVSRVDVFLDQRVYDWLGHFAVRKRTVQLHA